MRAASATALDHAKQRLMDDFDQMPGSEQNRAIGDEFLWLSDTLQGSGKLSEALTSTTRSIEDKHRLIDQAFGSASQAVSDADKDTQLQPIVIDVLKDLSSHTWSDADDLAQSCEELGLFTILSAAKRTQHLEDVQKDLFEIDSVLRGSRQLRHALAGKSRTIEDRLKLANQVFESSLSPLTMLLLRRVIVRTPSGRLLAAIRDLRVVTAQAQGKELAVIHTAVGLDDKQMDRLRKILEAKCGRPVHIDTEIDPEVIGGMRIRLGADLYEGTLAASLQQARTRLAG